MKTMLIEHDTNARLDIYELVLQSLGLPTLQTKETLNKHSFAFCSSYAKALESLSFFPPDIIISGSDAIYPLCTFVFSYMQNRNFCLGQHSLNFIPDNEKPFIVCLDTEYSRVNEARCFEFGCSAYEVKGTLNKAKVQHWYEVAHSLNHSGEPS